MPETTDIEWGYNCLTAGIHHGRPEMIWNIPLLYAVKIFRRDVLQELVVSRIYNDAIQITEHNDNFDEAWAQQVKAEAERRYLDHLKHKVGELSKYYDTPGWELEQQEAARRVTEDKLNAHYQPLHSHDSINMLCRIIGVSASRTVS